ncbi:MAG: NADH-quinone oxidoreductase subunit H [Candidatus Brocadiae bacterium]|nr:NADH-quinone oxidoreductase subunit H [Candidatus Brocadiia bacterium]
MQAVIAVILGIFGTVFFGLLFQWVDRLVTARIQWRKGPPIYQPLADILKLLGKETVVSERASVGWFLLAPVLGFTGVCVAACILWAALLNPQPDSGFVGDLIVVVYFLIFPSLALILGASASGNPYAAVGASREMKLVIAYELPFILAMVPPILKANLSLKLTDIVQAQSDGVTLASVGGFLAFLCMLAAVQAKLGVVPFDQAEAETELTGGAIVEYSGPALAMIRLTRGMLLFLLPLFVITVFWGGVHFSGWGWLTSPLKFIVLLVVIVLMRNTSPRLRIDQAMRFFWFIVGPIAVAAAFISVYHHGML